MKDWAGACGSLMCMARMLTLKIPQKQVIFVVDGVLCLPLWDMGMVIGFIYKVRSYQIQHAMKNRKKVMRKFGKILPSACNSTGQCPVHPWFTFSYPNAIPFFLYFSESDCSLRTVLSSFVILESDLYFKKQVFKFYRKWREGLTDKSFVVACFKNDYFCK